MSTPPLPVSVVICTRDRLHHLQACLQRVTRLCPPPSEIIVVDNGSHGFEVRQAAQQAGARYVREAAGGLSRARNRGAMAARSEIVVYIDDDAIPDDNWLPALVRAFRDPRVGIVFGRALPPDQAPELAELHATAGLADAGSMHRAVDSDSPDWFQQVTFGALGIGANMALRRSVFQVWSGFDERIGSGTPLGGHEETKATCALVGQGFRAVYTPDAVVQHPCPSRTATELFQRSLQAVHASSAYLTLMLFEDPEHRREILAYVWEKVRRGCAFRREMEHISARPQLVPRGRIFRARVHGILTYFRIRLGCHQSQPLA